MEAVVDDLRDGRNVVICLPSHAPAGLRAAVAERWEHGTSEWPLVDFRTGEVNGGPAEQLFGVYVPEYPADGIRSAATLVREPAFAGQAVWLSQLSADSWPRWKAFLSDYGHACNNVTTFERTLLCAPIIGDIARDPPAGNVCLSVHEWKGAVSGLDMLLYTSELFRARPMPDLHREVAVAVASRLAMWDGEVSDRLAEESFERILDPQRVLATLAAERGWDGGDVKHEPGWHTGATDVFDGAERLHSAALAAMADGGAAYASREIGRRIWSAEVGVILPLVEERRQEILDSLSGLLRLPFTTRFNEVITDLRDLELGHIESQMGQRPSVFPQELREAVPRLRRVRNCLAHHDPLTAEMLSGIVGL